jgi:hypothetical protein
VLKKVTWLASKIFVSTKNANKIKTDLAGLGETNNLSFFFDLNRCK